MKFSGPTKSAICALALSLSSSGCQSIQSDFVKYSTTPARVVPGPKVISNETPLDPAFKCVSDYILEHKRPRVSISVGNVKDYTGKYSEAEGGNAITQGGSLMVISALGKLGKAVAVRERFDTLIADREQAYIDAQRLGDGRSYIIENDGEKKKINWIPKSGGAVSKSQVYIVGGITELNYNLSSAGFTTEIAGVGPRLRRFTISVAADLRLVNTSNLNMIKSVSLQKQVVGYEVKAGVFKFFGNNLYNIEAGVKSQEPLQLAVRTILEMATLELVSKIYSIDHQKCFDPETMQVAQDADLRIKSAETGVQITKKDGTGKPKPKSVAADAIDESAGKPTDAAEVDEPPTKQEHIAVSLVEEPSKLASLAGDKPGTVIELLPQKVPLPSLRSFSSQKSSQLSSPTSSPPRAATNPDQKAKSNVITITPTSSSRTRDAAPKKQAPETEKIVKLESRKWPSQADEIGLVKWTPKNAIFW